MKQLFTLLIGSTFLCSLVTAQDEKVKVETVSQSKWVSLFNGKDLSGWVDVNTSETTWKPVYGELHCTGLPIGVMRSEKMYENFILEIEWKHMKKKGSASKKKKTKKRRSSTKKKRRRRRSTKKRSSMMGFW